MSYNFEERSFSNLNNGSFSFSSGDASASGALVASSGSADARANQIAQDLLLASGSGSGSASYSYGASSGSALGASGSVSGLKSFAYGSGSGSASAGGASGLVVSYGTQGGSSGSVYNSGSSGSGAGAGAGGSTTFVVGSSSGGAVVGGSGNGVYLSEIEQSILRSTDPITVNESEEITINGERGIWANRQEVVNWRGPVAISEYLINQDSNPEIITKRSGQSLEYIQELAIRYLRPPTPPAPGEIIITQEANLVTPPAPPLIIRQQPARPLTPEPLVIREAPPQAPAQVGRKVITISGKRIPPAPRKVVIERLAQLPSKPQSVLIERWLPYAQVKRRVIFNRPQQQDPVVVKPRNVIVQWEAPRVQIKKDIKYLGVIRANPAEYVQRYGTTLKQSADLPSFVQDIKTPDGLVLAANYKYNNLYELEGDLQALRLVDLDREGLAEYRSYLQRLGVSFTSAGSTGPSTSFSSGSFGVAGGSFGGNASGAGFAGASSFGSSFESSSASSSSAGGSASFIQEIFNSINRNSDGRISRGEAESAVLRINSRLGRSYGESDVSAFFAALDRNNDGYLDFEEFRTGFFRFFRL